MDESSGSEMVPSNPNELRVSVPQTFNSERWRGISNNQNQIDINSQLSREATKELSNKGYGRTPGDLVRFELGVVDDIDRAMTNYHKDEEGKWVESRNRPVEIGEEELRTLESVVSLLPEDIRSGVGDAVVARYLNMRYESSFMAGTWPPDPHLYIAEHLDELPILIQAAVVREAQAEGLLYNQQRTTLQDPDALNKLRMLANDHGFRVLRELAERLPSHKR